MISLDKIKEISKAELDPRIVQARLLNNKLRLHIDGIGLQEYLERINSYENEKQFDARKKHAISNQFITEELLRPTDNAFSAKGGSKSYQFKVEQDVKELEFVEKLLNVKCGQSLSEYVENDWFHKFLTDPNGLIFLEIQDKVNEDEEIEKVLVPTYKSIHSIRAYEQNGQKVDWIVFEPHQVKVIIEDEGAAEKIIKIFWVVDELFYYEFQEADGEIQMIDLIPNSFSYVPAILCSNITDNTTGWKASVIQKQVEILDKYLVSNSVLSIAEFLHNYPREWTYVDDCLTCMGSGKVINIDNTPGDMTVESNLEGSSGYDICSICNGSGKSDRQDVTDIIKLKVPEGDQQKIDPPSGYTVLPTDAWELMTSAVDRTWNLIYFSHWGTTTEKAKANETATGRFIDVQPVHNKLDKYSKSIERSHQLLANMFGDFYYPETFERAYVQYGRRYLVETPDQIWEKYLTAKEKNAPITSLDLLIMQYFESEYRENERLFILETKKFNLEPFGHWDIEVVRQSQIISISDKAQKEYYHEWLSTINDKEIIEKKLEVLKAELLTYVQSKINIDELNEKNLQQTLRQEGS